MNKRKKWMSVLLSTFILVQVLGEPSLLFAATDLTNSPTTNGAVPNSAPTPDFKPQVNPSQAEINALLEKVAKEEKIPSPILKAIAFQESSWHQFDSNGQPLLSPTGAMGIMQISPKYETPENIVKLKTDIEYNIRRGAQLLNEKWAFVPKIGDGDRNKLENWYFAIWAYNIWSGKNNPNEAKTSSIIEDNTPKADGSKVISRGGSAVIPTPAPIPAPTPVPYQERILSTIANPPSWLAHYIKAVEITPVPASSLPEQGVPQKTLQWTTPLPYHLGDLNMNSDKDTGKILPAVIPEWSRLQGKDRIDTALQQAQKGWPQGSTSVILARADDFPDALAGVPLAGRLQAPILLTSSKELDSEVLTTLKSLKPQTIYLLGGEGALGSKITSTLEKNGWNKDSLIRISGDSRYSTAASLAMATVASSLSAVTVEGKISLENIPQGAALQNVPAVAIATGENFPDALAIASIAGAKRMPILLTSTNGLPADTLKTLRRLNPAKVYLIGGNGSISPQVEQEIKQGLNMSASQIRRLAGASRYDTMAAVAQEFQDDIDNLSFATGENFPDALAGAALAAHQGSTIVLVPKNSLEPYPNLKNWIRGRLKILTNPTAPNAPQSLKLYLMGGTGAISEDLEKELKSFLGQ